MDATQVSMPQTEKIKRRFGLFPVRIGAQIMHHIGIAMPLEKPQHDAQQYGAPSKLAARTRVRPTKARYEMGQIQQGPKFVEVPIRALPGCPVYLEVQAWDRLSDEEREQVKWVCNHPDCKGKTYDTVSALQQDHEDDKTLVQQAEQDPHGRPHTYYGVLELPGTDGKPEVRDDKGKITQRAVEAAPPTIMVVSNEE